MVVLRDKLIEGFHLSGHEVPDLQVELSCGAVKEDVTLGLVSIEFSDLLLVDIGKKGNPLVNDAVLAFLYV